MISDESIEYPYVLPDGSKGPGLLHKDELARMVNDRDAKIEELEVTLESANARYRHFQTKCDRLEARCRELEGDEKT